MEAKVCKTCGLSKQISCFWKLKTGRYGVWAHCIECEKIRLRQRYINNRQQYLSRAAEYRKTEAGKQAKTRYSQSEKGRERNIKYLKEYNSSGKVSQKRKSNASALREKALQNRVKISNGYARRIIKTLSGGVLRKSDIPDNLVEIKRQSLFLKRLLRQKQQEYEHNTTTNI